MGKNVAIPPGTLEPSAETVMNELSDQRDGWRAALEISKAASLKRIADSLDRITGILPDPDLARRFWAELQAEFTSKEPGR